MYVCVCVCVCVCVFEVHTILNFLVVGLLVKRHINS